MRPLSLLALTLLFTATPALAAPPRSLLTLVAGDAGEAVKTLRSSLAKLPGASAGIPPEIRALLTAAQKMPLSGPATLELLRPRGKKAALVASLASEEPAKLKAALAKLLPAAFRKVLKLTATKDRVFLYSAPWALRHLKKNGKRLEVLLAKTPSSFTLTINLDAFLSAGKGGPKLAPIRIQGTLPHRWSSRAGPAVAKAIRPLLRNGASPKLKLLPAGVELISAGTIADLGALAMKLTGSDEVTKSFPGMTGKMFMARMPDSASSLRIGFYWRFAGNKARAAAEKAFKEAKNNLKDLRRVLDEDGVKVQKVSDGHYALVYPISLAKRAALAALGIKVPFPLILRWGVRGSHLVFASDEAFLAPKEPFKGTLPARVKGAAAWSWHVPTGRVSRLVWPTREVLMTSGNLSVQGDMLYQLMSRLPSFLFSWAIKQRMLEAFKIPAASMAPAILQGDHVWVDKRRAGKTPRRGEIVVFRFPQDPRKDFIKRVTALPGEKVKQVKGKGKGKGKGKTITVPPGHFYAVGDNKDNSFDSRHFGPVPISEIKGRAASVLWSRDSKGKIRWKRIGMRLK